MTYPTGKCLLTLKPFAHVLKQEETGLRCDHCLKPSVDLRKCSKCKLVNYCNRDCQKVAWRLHKIECHCLTQLDTGVDVDDNARLFFKLVYLATQQDKRLFKDSGNLRCFDNLMSHKNEISQDKNQRDIFTMYAKLVQSLFQKFPVTIPETQELLSIFGKQKINSFYIVDFNMKPIGMGLYLSAASFDHSCRPNAVFIFENSLLRVIALEDIQDISQVRINYLDLLSPSVDRKAQLMKQYYFECQCEACLDGDLDASMITAVCPDPKCRGALTQADLETSLLCGTCGVFVEKELVHQKTLAIKKFVESEEQDDSPDTISRLSALTTFLKDDHNPTFNYRNVFFLRLLQRGLICSMLCEDYDSARDFYKMGLIKGYRLYFTEGYPLVGLTLKTMASIERFFGNSKMCLTYTNQACESLKSLLPYYHETRKQIQELFNSVSV